MPFIGNKPSAVPLTAADIADGIITSAKIVDGTIVNADINASAGLVLTKLASTGTLTVDNIQFPSTQVASANANNLDDYEEGTWTPTFTSGVNTLTITGGTQNFKYVKIGKTCFLSVNYQDVTVSGTTSSSDQRITLPFTSATGIRQPSNIVSFFTSGGLRFTTPTLTYFEIGSNDTIMELRSLTSSGYGQPGTPTTGSGTYFWFTLTYEVA